MFTMTSIPAQKVYSPPSPILSCGKRLTASFGHDKKATRLEGNGNFDCDECKYSPECAIHCNRRRRAPYVDVDNVGEDTGEHPTVSRKRSTV